MQTGIIWEHSPGALGKRPGALGEYRPVLGGHIGYFGETKTWGNIDLEEHRVFWGTIDPGGTYTWGGNWADPVSPRCGDDPNNYVRPLI